MNFLRPFAITVLLLVAVVAFAVDQPPGLSVTTDGSLRLRGEVFRGIGVNYYDVFVRTLETPSRTNFEAGFRELAVRKIPFARFSAGGYWPVEWKLYQTNRTEYFQRFDAVVRSAELHGIGLIPSLFWQLSTVPDLVGEACDQWGNPASLTVAFMREYTREVVLRYRGSPAIWAWEFGNEYNLPADLPNAAEHRPPVVAALGTPAMRSPRDELTHDILRTALREFAAEVRHHDPHRAIISGNAFPRISAWHQWKERSWQRDTSAQFVEVLAGDNPDPINTLSVRAYDLTNDVGRIAEARSIAGKFNKPLFVGEFGVPGELTPTSREAFSSILRALETNHVSIAALWVFDFDGQSADWNVTVTNSRAWQLAEVQKMNRRITGR